MSTSDAPGGHATEHELATLVHGSAPARDAAALRAHLAACADCRAALAALRDADRETAALLRLLDHAPPLVGYETVLEAARRRRRYRAGPIAAGLALAVAGTAAALPSSPVHRALVRAIAAVQRGREPVGAVPRAVSPTAHAAISRGAGIALTPGQRIEVRFRQPGTGTLRIDFVPGSRLSLLPQGGAPAFTVERDRIVVDDSSGQLSFRLQVPRSLPHVRVRIDTAVVFRLDAGDVVAAAPRDAAGGYTLALGGARTSREPPPPPP